MLLCNDAVNEAKGKGLLCIHVIVSFQGCLDFGHGLPRVLIINVLDARACFEDLLGQDFDIRCLSLHARIHSGINDNKNVCVVSTCAPPIGW